MILNEFNEPAFGLDEFHKPLSFKGWKAVAMSVIMILFGKPGFYPSIPELGIYIQQYVNVRLDQLDIDELKVKLAYQCSIVKDSIIDGSIDIKRTMANGQPALLIIIPIEEGSNSSQVLIGLTSDGNSMRYQYDLINAAIVE